jgi:hypothetical protein
MSEYEIKWPEFTRKTSAKSGAVQLERTDDGCTYYLTTRIVQSCDASLVLSDLNKHV